MPKDRIKEKDERINQVLEHILRLTGSDYGTRLKVPKSGDDLEDVYNALNALARELEIKAAAEKEINSRLDKISEVIIEYAVTADFSRKVTLSDKGDMIDAISAGLNALGEELSAAFSTQKKYARDIERANRLLRESNEKIQTIFNNAPDAIIASDMDFKITEWNKAAEELYGYKRYEMIGRSAEEIIHSEHIPPFTREQAAEQLRKTGVWNGEFYQSTPRKKRMIILSSTSFIKNEKGIPIGYLGVNRDVSDMREIEKALGQSEKRFHVLVNEVTDYSIILLDTNGIITSWNKGAEKIKGYKEEEILGKHFSVFYTEEDQLNKIPEKALKEAKRKKKISFEGWRVRKDRSLFWADVVITELSDEEGKTIGFAKITRDLTERRKAEEEIAKKTQELKRSNTELEQFAYVASHDLQEPLRMITSYVQLLDSRYKDKLDQDAHDFINYAVDGATRMQTLIYSLLEYSRINRFQPFEFVNLDDVLNEVLRDLSVSIKETKAKISWSGLPVIYADKVLIGQLFFNLIGNAIKFRSNKTPEIVISCEKEDNHYLFSVKDNGIGLKKEYAQKIFVIFQRLHSKDKYPGTGIGLAICKKIVERHEGKIWVESELDKGSTFYFTLKADWKTPQRNNKLTETNKLTENNKLIEQGL